MPFSLFDRTVSGFPLSISTGLAFESLFTPRQSVYDPERPVPPKVDISQFNQMWINMDTLFRNMMDAADKNALMNTGYKEAANVLLDEINTIESLLGTEGGNIMSPVFYLCDYEKALKSLPKGFSVRPKTTTHQLFLKDLKEKTMRHLLTMTSSIKVFQGAIRADGKASALILTHVPYDLLSKRLFRKLDLLESNTGKLKTPRQWNSKYYPVPNANMAILPFNRPLLMSLGDKVLIQPWPISVRRQILEVASKRDWTPVTTTDKVMLDLRLSLHPVDFAFLETVRVNA